MIYFVRAAGTDYVKIGYTLDDVTLKTRIATLQTGQPWRLELLRVIKGAEQWQESVLHTYFRIDRHHGEWFTYNPVMMDITIEGGWIPLPSRQVALKREVRIEARAALESLIERLVTLLDEWVPDADSEPESDHEPDTDEEPNEDGEPDADEYTPIKFGQRPPAPYDQYVSEDAEPTLQPAIMDDIDV
jgi:hypothetical protein